MSVSRVIFALCTLAFAETFFCLVLAVSAEERFSAIGLMVAFLGLWGAMTYFAGARIAAFRSFWIFCAAAALGSFFLLFGATVFNEETPDSLRASEAEESPSEARYLSKNPWLVFRFYALLYEQLKDPRNDIRANPIFIGFTLLSVALPLAFLVSLFHGWKPLPPDRTR